MKEETSQKKEEKRVLRCSNPLGVALCHKLVTLSQFAHNVASWTIRRKWNKSTVESSMENRVRRGSLSLKTGTKKDSTDGNINQED